MDKRSTWMTFALVLSYNMKQTFDFILYNEKKLNILKQKCIAMWNLIIKTIVIDYLLKKTKRQKIFLSKFVGIGMVGTSLFLRK